MVTRGSLAPLWVALAAAAISFLVSMGLSRGLDLSPLVAGPISVVVALAVLVPIMLRRHRRGRQ